MTAARGPLQTSAAAETDPGTVTGGPSSSRFLRRFIRHHASLVAMLFLVLLVGVALAAPWLAPYDPLETDISHALEGVSTEHWFGTDDLGRDTLSRLLFATRISLVAAATAVVIALCIGLPVGLVSGYLGGGWWDAVIMRANDALMSFPVLILAIAIVGFLGPSLTNVMIAIGLVFAPRLVRIVRGTALSVRKETYFMASRSLGCTPYRLIRWHLLPNVLSPVFVQTSLSLGLAMLAEASLSFVGLGVQPPAASLGSMLATAVPFLDSAPILVLPPGVTITLAVLSFNMLGDGLRDSLGRETRSGQ